MAHNWAFRWKMNFNADPTKQVQEEVILSRKTNFLNFPQR